MKFFEGSGSGRPPLHIKIDNKNELYKSYMPFVNNGGLFISTEKTESYKLGGEVFILLKLMDESEKIPVTGTVIWVTPKGAQGSRIAGIGVQFKDEDTVSAGKIETHLAGLLESDRSTHTM